MQNQVETTTLPLLLTVAKAVIVSGLSRSQTVRANDGETQTPLEFRPYGAEG
jgi:hypothetical protein